MSTTAIGFVKAVKHESYLRMALAGPSGAGKTYTALSIATALAGGKPIAVIDTERGSASKYADVFDFSVLELDSFHPDRYVEAIQAAVDAGFGVVVIDSLTHAWEGTGGLLEIVNEIAKRKYQGNTFRAWAEGTPIQNRLIDAMTASRIHVIATMRTKTEYATEKDERTGKTSVQKLGTTVKQRDGMEYEFDVVGRLTIDNELVIEKTRCSALAGKVIAKPGRQVAETLGAWLAGARPEAPAKAEAPAWRLSTDKALVERLKALGVQGGTAVMAFLREWGVETPTQENVTAAIRQAEAKAAEPEPEQPVEMLHIDGEEFDLRSLPVPASRRH
jgi:hypothetical protein